MSQDEDGLRRIWDDALAMVRDVAAYAMRVASAWTRHLWRVRADVVLATVLGLAAAAFAVWRFYGFDFSVMTTVFDLWYDGDAPRVVESNLDRFSQLHYRTAVHPLFALLVSLPLVIISKLGLSPQAATALFIGASAFALAAMFYAAARSIAVQRFGAILLTVLLFTTSAAMFWAVVPESYALGGATILLSLIWLASARSAQDTASGPLQSALSLSITITNWMAGLVAALLAMGPRRGLWISVLGFLIVVGLSLVQQLIFPNAGKMFNILEEANYVLVDRLTIGDRVASLAHTILVARPEAIFTPLHQMRLGFGAFPITPAFCGALLSWIALAALAIEAILKGALPTKVRAFLFIVIAAQLALHAVYGEGYFLYSLHFVPLFVLVIAAALLGPRKNLALAFVTVAILATGSHNLAQLTRATALHNSYPARMLEANAGQNARGEVLWAMHQRPDDPWPTSAGHFVWGAPGAPLAEKGYFEPGGSLSPRVGGPGFSIWIFDASGAIVGTSDQQDAASVTQRFEFGANDVAPDVVFEAPLYTARWSETAPNRWALHVESKQAGNQLALSIRGVGPASGPLHEISTTGADTVQADACWTVRVTDGRVGFLGQEGAASWLVRDADVVRSHTSTDGWAAAHINAPQDAALNAEIQNTCVPGSAPLYAFNGGVQVSPANLPIAEVLNNQSAQLLMGLEGNQTRPGDPIAYPLEWLRDGAYTVVAMARGGRMDVARDLIGNFATQDFFGGFGSEADSPGISLWAMGEVSRAAHDADLDRSLLPHAKRKADFILELLNTREEIRRPFVGPTTVNSPDSDFVARAASRGMINGRMDWQEPVFFVNGFAWRGLVEAAGIAERAGAAEDAARYRDAARTLRAMWRRRLRTHQVLDERTAASMLWPTEVAAQERPLIEALLANSTHLSVGEPLWTYFIVAHAHQFLLLGDPERAWTQIEAVTALSPLPSLGVLWEGHAGEDSNWRDIRGGARAPALMPHYWSSAELMLFALDGLAFVDATDNNTLVVGGGMRRAWLAAPVSVAGVVTAVGPVDWRWDGATVTVVVNNPDTPVRLGPAFPANTRIVRVTRAA